MGHSRLMHAFVVYMNFMNFSLASSITCAVISTRPVLWQFSRFPRHRANEVRNVIHPLFGILGPGDTVG